MLISFGETIWDVYPGEATLGGAPLNLAAHAANLVCPVLFLSAVGADEYGARAIAAIGALGLDTRGVAAIGEAPSGVCTVTADEAGQPHYALAAHSAYDHIPLPQDLPAEADILAFGTLAMRHEENRHTLSRLLSVCRCREVYVDLNIRPPYFSKESVSFCLSHATLLKVSDEDLAHITPLLSLPFGEGEAIAALAGAYPALRLIIVTKGAEGSCCYDIQSGRMHHCPAAAACAVSTVGAGDSYGAAFLAMRLRGKSIPDAMQAAATLSAFVVSRQGAIPPGAAELAASLISG